jgi:hypothetical protein
MKTIRSGMILAVGVPVILAAGGCDMQVGSQESAGLTPAAGERPCIARGGPPVKNCFIIELEDPIGSSYQPMAVDGPLSLGGRQRAHVQDDLPDNLGAPQTITVWPDITPDDRHSATHEHDGGATGSGHCHYWYRLSNGSYIQLHC